MNINRDYLIINDVKKSNITLDNGSMFFYITDKNTQNIFVNLVINVSNNELIQKYANIENAEDYTLTMNIIKPNNVCKIIEGKLHDKEKGIFEFNLKKDCCDVVGTYKCELLTKCNINEQEEITTSNSITYIVKKSILNDLDDIVEAPEYPVVIQLLDKLSDIEQYEEDRRANELARQLAEEQRQARFNTLDADMTNSIQVIDNKVVDVENRIASKEQAVDKLITDTKADIDEYKVAKDQEIDDYKATKDTEINTAITAQDNKIDTAISNQNDRITVVENNDVAQNNRLDVLENKDVLHESRLDAIEAKNVEQDNRLNDIEAIDVAQNTRLDAIEAKNQQQDDRLLDIEKVNKRQDIDLKCLFTEAKNNMIDVTEEGNSIYLQNSTTGYTLIDEIKGNTLVNCNKEPDKELILNGNINTSGDNAVTLTEGVDGGLVDVALEGNTLVNVSKTKDSTAITKAYTVENSGNHIALQGEVDGSCRPVISGKTLVNIGEKLRHNWNLINSGSYSAGWKNLDIPVKSASKYTFIFNYTNTTGVDIDGFRIGGKGYTFKTCYCTLPSGNGTLKVLLTSIDDISISADPTRVFMQIVDNYTGEVRISNSIVLEGDYSDKPMPDYFEGLQSTFEDNLVTQEMIDSGEEVADNLGKYRVDYKVTGKNKLNLPSAVTGWDGGEIAVTDSNIVTFTPNDRGTQSMTYQTVFTDANFKKGTQLTLSATKLSGTDYTSGTFAVGLSLKDVNGNEITGMPNTNCPDFTPSSTVGDIKTTTMTLTQDIAQIGLYAIAWGIQGASGDTVLKLQLEYGNTATSYEPYKEYTKTLYLNSPLLEGDTIEEKDNGIYHVHRYKKVVLDSSLSPNSYTIKSASITNNNKKTLWIIMNKNVFPNRAYKFISDKFINISWDKDIQGMAFGDNVDIMIEKSKLISLDKTGVNDYFSKNPTSVVYEISSPQYELIEQSNLVIPSYANGYLDFTSAVPVEKMEFKPFSEELTYLYANTQYTVQFVSDRTTTADMTLGGTSLLAQSIVAGLNRISITTPATLADNKLIISGVGANISEVVVTDTDREFGYFEGMKSVGEGGNLVITSSDSDNSQSNTQQLTHEPLRAIGEVKDRYVLIDGKWYIERNCVEFEINSSNIDIYSTWYGGSNPNGSIIGFLIRKEMLNIIPNRPTTNGIFTKSDTIKSTFYDDLYWNDAEGIAIVGGVYSFCIKINKSKLTTVSQSGFIQWLQDNPIKVIYINGTPQYEPIDYNPLEVYSGTTHITTNSVIPCNITVKNHGFNCLLKPSTTYTISSNLGLNTVTTPSTLTEDCLRFMDTDTSDITTMKDVLVLEGDWTSKANLIPTNFSGIESAFEQEYDSEKGKYRVNVKVTNEDKSKENNITFYINEPSRGVGNVKDRVYVKDDKVVVQRNCGIRAYEDGDFGTYLTDKVNTVYPLAEPTYEEIEYNDTKLFIESFKNSTLLYNSNVPVTSKLYYSYSVPIVDTVAQTANVTDQQDSMIIDLATQVAVMEMMLM